MDFTQPWDFGDITFIIEDRKIYANKIVLTMSSEVFRAMFTSDFKDSKMTEIPLPGKKFDDFLQLMQILQAPPKCVDDTNVNCILPLAHEYQIQHVFENCVKTLLHQSPTIQNLNLSEKYNLPQLHEKCLKYAELTPLSQLRAEHGFAELKPDTLFDLLNSKVEKSEILQTEVIHIASWGELEQCEGCSGCNRYTGTNRDCLQCIKYRFDKICEVVKRN